MAGTHEGTALVFPQLTEAFEPFDNKPHAQKIVDATGANLVILEFAEGQVWREHHSVHPVIVQVLKGRVEFTVKDEIIDLVPGMPIHLTSHLLHQVRAMEPSTLMVTMLTGETHEPAKTNVEGIRSV